MMEEEKTTAKPVVLQKNSNDIVRNRTKAQGKTRHTRQTVLEKITSGSENISQ